MQGAGAMMSHCSKSVVVVANAAAQTRGRIMRPRNAVQLDVRVIRSMILAHRVPTRRRTWLKPPFVSWGWPAPPPGLSDPRTVPRSGTRSQAGQLHAGLPSDGIAKNARDPVCDLIQHRQAGLMAVGKQGL